MMRGYNFTERVRRILAMAREEAARLHHEYVGTEHILLGFLGEGNGVGMEVLRALGADPQALASRVEKGVRAGRASPDPRYDLPYTSRAKKVLELAMNEAMVLSHGYVGSEHLLLGMLAEAKGIAAQVLADAGVTLDQARSECVRILGSGPALEAPAKAESSLGELIGEEQVGALRAVARVEVILHYGDGGRYQASFATVDEAVGLLRWLNLGGR
jgi:ATP-dependent Clp protease ATP-binding subunit ClpA